MFVSLGKLDARIETMSLWYRLTWNVVAYPQLKIQVVFNDVLKFKTINLFMSLNKQ